MRVINGVDELRAAVGEHLGYSSWHEVTQERIDQFAEATGDHQWIHVDPERAKDGPFGSTIAHGYLTLSMVPMLVWEVYRVDGVKMGVNYGCDKVRFPHPVPVGSKLRATAVLGEVADISLGSRAAWDWTIEAEGIDKPVCIARMLSVVVP